MFDLIPASTQYVTVPGTVVTQDSLTVSIWLQPDFAPDSATVYNVVDVVGVRYRLYHSAANTWTMYADGRTKTFDVTGLWIAGQLVHVKATWVKTGDVMTLAIHGTEITPSAGSGTWGTTAVGATLRFGADASAADTFDGELGTPAVWNRALTAAELAALVAGNPAKECALSGLMWSAPFDCTEKADFNPGGEEATMVGSPLISQHPLCLRRGARVMVEGAQGALGATGLYENPGWTRTGTPTASTKIESVAAPAGTHPALGAQVIQVDHLATENAIYDIKSFGTQTKGYLSAHVQGVTGSGTCRLLGVLGPGSESSLRLFVAPTLLTVTRYPAGSTPTWTKTIAAGRWYRVELRWDTVAGTTQFLVDGVSVGSASEVLEYTPTKVLIGHDSTSTTVQARIAALDIRSDRAPDALYDGAWDLNGSADYLTAPQAVAEAILNKGGVLCYIRPDWTPAEAATRSIFGIDVGTSAIHAIRLSSGNLVRLLNNGRLKDFAVTGLWASGQWLLLIFAWDKDTDTLRMWLNGTEITGSISGTWGAEAVSSVLAFGANEVGANKVDGGIGRIALLNDVPTAGEIAALSDGLHLRQVCPSKWVESWRPGSLMGEKGVYNLTTVGAPAIDQGPGIQDAQGLVEVRSHFEGVGYEQPWTAAGTPTADTRIDPDAAAPAGWPAWAGKPCRFKQLATENAMSISKVLSATDIDTLWYREVLYVATLPGAAVEILSMQGAAARTAGLLVTNTKIQLVYHIAAGDQVVDLVAAAAAGRCYYVEIGYSVSGQWVAYRINGHLGNKPYTYITGVTLDRGGMRSLYLRTSTVTAYSIDMYRGAVEGRTDGPSLVPPYSGATMRNRMMLVGT